MLTRDEIMSMQAGRELDALIAEMMGYTRIDEPDTFWLIDHAWENLDKPVYWMTERWGVKVADRNGHRTFSPTRNIADAWQVVEKLQAEPDEYFFGIQMTPAIPHKGAPCWHVELGGKHAHAPTAPLAICRASLLCKL